MTSSFAASPASYPRTSPAIAMRETSPTAPGTAPVTSCIDIGGDSTFALEAQARGHKHDLPKRLTQRNSMMAPGPKLPWPRKSKVFRPNSRVHGVVRSISPGGPPPQASEGSVVRRRTAAIRVDPASR